MIPASSKSRSHWTLAALAAVSVFCGCHGAPKAPLPNPPASSLSVTLKMRPASPRQMDPVTFIVTVADKHGKPIQNAHVSAELVMPSMEMGRNTVAFKPSGAAARTGTGRFTMSGEWNVVVTASVGKDKVMRPFPVAVR